MGMGTSLKLKMSKKLHFIYISIIFVLVLVCLFSFNRGKKVEVITTHSTDTLYYTKVDTFIQYKPIFVEKRTIDTLYLNSTDDAIRLPIVQKRYTKDNLYDLCISGVEPLNLDTINVFRNTEYITINNEIEKVIYKQKWNIYGFVGLNSISEAFSPKMGILLTAPKKWLISAEIGYYDNSAFYGLNIGYKINE